MSWHHVKAKFQWFPIALGMNSKPLTRVYKAWHYRGPDCLPNLILRRCCLLAHPGSVTSGCSLFLFPASESPHLLFPLPGLLTPPLLTSSSFSSSGPSFTHISPETLPLMKSFSKYLLRTCSRPSAGSGKTSALLELPFKLRDTDNQQINREILYIFCQMW